MSRNLSLRILVATVGIPALIFISYFNGIYLFIFSIVLVGLSSLELTKMLRYKGYNVNRFLSVILPILCITAVYYGYSVLDVLVLSFFLVSLMAIKKYSGNDSKDLTEFLGDFFSNLLPVFYLGLLATFIIYLGKVPDGGLFIIFVFLVVWAADTAAYFGGKALGKNKLSVNISPNKTREGFYSGFFGAILAGVVSKSIFLDIGWIQVIVLSLIACFFGQMGDLFESAIKRHCGVKDASAIIPGHGGVLDRFDSFFFAVPVVYLIVVNWRNIF